MSLRYGGRDGDEGIRLGPGNPIASDAYKALQIMCGCNTSLFPLLVLAAALGCLVFLFNLFGDLQSSSESRLLDRSDSSAATIKVLSGAQLTQMLAAFLCWVLAAGTAWLCWQRLKEPKGKRLLTGLLSALGAVAFFAVGLYLGTAAATQGSLPSGNLPYDHHQVDLTGVEPLGLALLAAFVLSVAVVGIVRPRLVIIPVLVWLALAFMFGMFGSAAIKGLNLFDRPAKTTAGVGVSRDRSRIRSSGAGIYSCGSCANGAWTHGSTPGSLAHPHG